MKRNTLAIVVLLLAVQSCQSGGAPTAASTGAPEATTDTMLHADWEDPVIDATAIGEGTVRAGKLFQRPDLPQKLSIVSSVIATVVGLVWCGQAFMG